MMLQLNPLAVSQNVWHARNSRKLNSVKPKSAQDALKPTRNTRESPTQKLGSCVDSSAFGRLVLEPKDCHC